LWCWLNVARFKFIKIIRRGQAQRLLSGDIHRRIKSVMAHRSDAFAGRQRTIDV
jgi:hypothetical protein